MTRPEKDAAVEIENLVRDLRPLMRGYHRSVQWAALAELMALWAIEHAAVRTVLLDPLLRIHVNTVRKLIDSHVADGKDRDRPT